MDGARHLGLWAVIFGLNAVAILAAAWSIAVRAAMMVAMPLMMPMVGFPRWFPVVPLVAHVAMVVPIGAAALVGVTASMAGASLVGTLSSLLGGG